MEASRCRLGPCGDSAFEDEAKKLRQLKLDNQVKQSPLFCNKWRAILTGMPIVVTLKSWQGYGRKTGKEKALSLLTKQCLELVFAGPRPWAWQAQSALRTSAIKLALDL